MVCASVNPFFNIHYNITFSALYLCLEVAILLVAWSFFLMSDHPTGRAVNTTVVTSPYLPPNILAVRDNSASDLTVQVYSSEAVDKGVPRHPHIP